MLGRDIEETKNTKIKLLEMKTTIAEIKNTPDGINSRWDIADTNISEPKNITVKTIQNKTQKKQRT